MIRVFLCLIIFATPVFAQEGDEDDLGPSAEQTVPPTTSKPPVIRPEGTLAAELLQAGPMQGPPAPPPGLPARLAPEVLAACLSALPGLGVAFEPQEDVRDDIMRGCVIRDPVLVSSVGDIEILPPAVMTCPTAEALARWTRDFVVPAADAWGERGALNGLTSYGTYSCRNVNNSATGRRSEHSYGRAIDISGFEFEDGPRLPVQAQRRGSGAAAFQATVRAAACLPFRTVIGPGGDAFHDDHLHLDVAPRRSGFRYCR